LSGVSETTISPSGDGTNCRLYCRGTSGVRRGGPENIPFTL
jgi:hypothetical protein